MDLQNLNIESLEQLKYTGCVIKETLRINPPVPGGFRVALKTFELNVSNLMVSLLYDLEVLDYMDLYKVLTIIFLHHFRATRFLKAGTLSTASVTPMMLLRFSQTKTTFSQSAS